MLILPISSRTKQKRASARFCFCVWCFVNTDTHNHCATVRLWQKKSDAEAAMGAVIAGIREKVDAGEISLVVPDDAEE